MKHIIEELDFEEQIWYNRTSILLCKTTTSK